MELATELVLGSPRSTAVARSQPRLLSLEGVIAELIASVAVFWTWYLHRVLKESEHGVTGAVVTMRTAIGTIHAVYQAIRPFKYHLVRADPFMISYDVSSFG